MPIAIHLAALAFASFPSHDEPLRTGATAPGDAGVVIGIEDYFALPAVPYATRDAQAFHDLLVYTLGVPPAKIQRVTKDASKERIQEALTDAAASVAPDGTLWVYFAGHGAASPATGERVLLGIDTMASAASFEARAMSLSDVQRHTESAGRRVMVVDACFAGRGRSGGDLLPGKRFAVPAYVAPTTSSWIAWHAAQPNELSGPLPAARHGAFTWAVIGALRGWADGQVSGTADGVITLEEASLFAEDILRVVEVTDQRPTLHASTMSEPLVRLPVDRQESRPSATELRAEVTPVPSPAPPAPRPTSPPVLPTPSPATPRMPLGCTPERRSQEELEAASAWAIEPGGPTPRATWTCQHEGVPMYLSRILGEEGTSLADLVILNVLSDQTHGGGKLSHRLAVPAGVGVDRRSISDSDPATWPTFTAQSPHGSATGYVVPVLRLGPNPKGAGRVSSSVPTLVVADHRQAGAALTCKLAEPPYTWSRAVSACRGLVESVLAQDAVDPGRVR